MDESLNNQHDDVVDNAFEKYDGIDRREEYKKTGECPGCGPLFSCVCAQGE